MYDHELVLINQTITQDAIGNEIPTETRTTILCKLESVGRNEFYNAAQNNMKPEIVFTIHAYEYNNEQVVEFDSVKYKVIRTYKVSFEEIELTCEKVTGI